MKGVRKAAVIGRDRRFVVANVRPIQGNRNLPRTSWKEGAGENSEPENHTGLSCDLGSDTVDIGGN